MKLRLIFNCILISALTSLFVSCGTNDHLDKESVIYKPDRTENEFDKWLDAYYLMPYNIQVQYRFQDIEQDFLYHLSPASVDKSIQLAHLIKYMCIEPYDLTTGDTKFIRQLFPKVLCFTGSPAINANGTERLGVAEGGRKIILYKVNGLDPSNLAEMNFFFFHTIHHEFTHIQNQTKPYPVEFQTITGTTYVDDAWSDEETYGTPKNSKIEAVKPFITTNALQYLKYKDDIIELLEKNVWNEKEQNYLFRWIGIPSKEYSKLAAEGSDKIVETKKLLELSGVLKLLSNSDINALRKGYISPYASKNDVEDFAELQAFYITNTPNEWNTKLELAGEVGSRLISRKMDIVKSYLKDAWNIDIDLLRDIVQKRTLSVGDLNLNTTEVK